MKRLIPAILLILIFYKAGAQNTTGKASADQNKAEYKNGYFIPVTITPFKNCWVYLGSYYGKYKNLVDSVWMNDKSEAVFKGKNKLPGGIYFIVTPEKSILFEFLMDAPQHFSIVADSAHTENTQITGSAENTAFQTYTKFLATKVPQLTALQSGLAQAKTAEDSTKIHSQIVEINKTLNTYRENVIRQHPESMLALFFQVVKRPEVAPLKPGESYPFAYVKEHFWDGVPFNDDRLLHTPFFDPKLDEYFKYYVAPEPDSIIAEVNYMLLSARTGKDMFKYLLGKFTDKYINPEIMGQDKVFLFLFDKFYSKGDTAWLTAKQKEYIFNRAYSLIANQINEPAPVLNLVDTLGKTIPLYSLKAPFTVVVFWDPNCGHCKEEIPRMDSFYQAKWKNEGVKIYSVNVAEAAVDAWKEFINKHHLQTWTHVYQTKEERLKEQSAGQANFRQLYDVVQTPTMYLLDKDKRIIAKKLSLDQFDEVIQAKQKKVADAVK